MNRFELFFILAVLIGITTSLCHAEIQTWTDENGIKHLESTDKKETPIIPQKSYQQYPRQNPPQYNKPIKYTDINNTNEFKKAENAFLTILTTLTACTSFIIVLLLSFFILWLIELIDILKNEFTGSNKIVWVLIITFLPFIGFFLYHAIGKKQKIEVNNNSDINTQGKIKYKRLSE